MQKAFGKKSVIFMFLFPAFLIYTAFVIVSIVWAGYYSFFDWSGVGEKVSGIWRFVVCNPSFQNQKRKSCFTDLVLHSGSNFICCNLSDFYKAVFCNTDWNHKSDFIICESFI